MTRDINITVVSMIADDIEYVSDSISHGKVYNNYPINTIYGTSNSLYSATGQMVIELHKTTGSSYGVTGNLTYQLPNAQGQLVLMFNNPYTQAGSGYNGNLWLYPAITNIPSGSTTTYYCSVSGLPMVLDPPLEEDTMDVTVTVYEIPSTNS